jgi:hypothetical protein
MKSIHKIMVLNAIVLALWGALVFQMYQANDLGCMTDTECEAE